MIRGPVPLLSPTPSYRKPPNMKTFHSTLITFCFAVICLATPKAHAQNIVQNPGFETGTTFGGANPWTIADPNPPSPASVIGVNPPFAHSGTQYAALGTFGTMPSLATLSQTLTTIPGAAYTLSFWLAHDVTTPPPAISNMFQVFFGASGFALMSDVGSFGYTFLTVNVVATSASTVLQFRFLDGNDFFRLDDVSVVQQTVPESGATAALLALPAFAGLLLLHSRLRTRKSLVS